MVRDDELLLGFGAAALAALFGWFGWRALSRTALPLATSSWRSWHGARPEPRGWPRDTILAVPGLDTVSPEARRLLLGLAEDLQIPVDSLATVISHESRWSPSAGNDLPAAGLIQLTVGAHLPGFGDAAAIQAIRSWSAERQLREVVRPFYERLSLQLKAIRGGSPGTLVLANFLPADVGRPIEFRLGDSTAPTTWRRNVYRSNAGLDREHKGYFTVDDVYAAAQRVVAEARGRRLQIDESELKG